MIAALCTFLALSAVPTLGDDSQVLVPPSPCPTVFRYDPPGSNPGWWSGIINLSSDFLLHSLWLDIVLDSPAIKLLHKTTEANTRNFKIFRIEDERMQIHPGTPTTFSFSVQYETNGTFPRLQAIRLNGIVICYALLPERETDTGIKTNINTTKRPVINPSTQSTNSVSSTPPNKPDPENTVNATGDNSAGSRGQETGITQTHCGMSTLESKWPWVASLYNLQKGYICGATLISHQHVITSAKCVLLNFNPDTPVRASNLVVRLGKHDLASIDGVQIRLVQKMIVSSDYKSGARVYNGLDAALLVLHEPVTYNEWIRPVCLWPASQIDIVNVIGKKGWLVGWGRDDNHVLVEQLSVEEIPVVSEDTCFKSEGYAVYNITSAYNNYCAGTREDTVLCKTVDKGNGMVFKMGDFWYLRGHISFYVTRKLKKVKTCDPTGFFQFADLAKGLPWIYGVVSSYI